MCRGALVVQLTALESASPKQAWAFQHKGQEVQGPPERVRLTSCFCLHEPRPLLPMPACSASTHTPPTRHVHIAPVPCSTRTYMANGAAASHWPMLPSAALTLICLRRSRPMTAPQVGPWPWTCVGGWVCVCRTCECPSSCGHACMLNRRDEKPQRAKDGCAAHPPSPPLCCTGFPVVLHVPAELMPTAAAAEVPPQGVCLWKVVPHEGEEEVHHSPLGKQRSCALPGCGLREEESTGVRLFACACRGVGYCTPAHQRQHWEEHRATCSNSAQQPPLQQPPRAGQPLHGEPVGC